VNRSRIALFLASAGLVAVSGGCSAVPTGGGDATPPKTITHPVVAPPPLPDAKRPDAEKPATQETHEGGEGGEGGEG
jgi:hypothetical protein